MAIQGALGAGFDGITIGADFTTHTNAFNNRSLPFYYGPGSFSVPRDLVDRNILGVI